MSGINGLIDAFPKEQYVKDQDVRKTDIKDGFFGHITGLRYIRGKNFGENFVGIIKSTLSWVNFLTRPLQNIAKTLFTPLTTICSHVTKLIRANQRKDLFPQFKDAADLSGTQCKHFAREAELCSSTSHGRGVPGIDKNNFDRYRLPEGCSLIGGESFRDPQTGAKDKANKIFDALPTNLKANIEKHKGAFIDKNTGLVMNFIVDTGKVSSGEKPKIHIVFPGTQCGAGTGTFAAFSKVSLEHYATDFSMSGLTTDVPQSFRQATQIVKLMKDKFGGDYDLEVKGFSMGGGLATYAGIDNDLKTTALCPAPLSPTLQKRLTDEKMRNAVNNNKIINLSVKNCWVTDQKTIGKIGRTWERFSGQTIPHLIGGGYRVNKDYPKYNNAHNASSEIWKAYSETKLIEITEI